MSKGEEEPVKRVGLVGTTTSTTRPSLISFLIFSISIEFFIAILWYRCHHADKKSEGGDEMEGLNQPSAKAACQERGARLVEVAFTFFVFLFVFVSKIIVFVIVCKSGKTCQGFHVQSKKDFFNFFLFSFSFSSVFRLANTHSPIRNKF